MSLLFRILRAAHARGTHHKLALDALHRLKSPDAARWERVFLEQAELYMTGAKAPDDEFKDFKNHVLHPRDGYWGGAPEKVESWYGHLVAALKAGQWSEAVWCAGVLSHYATDPVHPFHTAQSEAENAIHRAAEWSINRSYDSLWREAVARHGDLDVAVPDGPHALKAMICAAADRSNAQYEKLIAHYDINRGVVEPTEGLDPVARALIGELLVYAATLHARLLDRAVAEAGVAPPEVSLGLDTVVAALKIPLKALLKKLDDNADRRTVEAMYDELKSTGRVEATLPEDDRAVRDLYAAEVAAPRLAKTSARREARLPAVPEADAARRRAAVVAEVTPQRPAAVAKGGIVTAQAVPPPLAQPRHPEAATSAPVVAPPLSAPAPVASAAAIPAQPEAERPRRSLQEQIASVPSIARAAARETSVPSVEPSARLTPRAETLPVTAAAPAMAPEAAGRTGDAVKATAAGRPPLAATDDLEAAPSIGPKTAERFAMAGIRSVGDFLAADPEATAAKLGQRHITPEVIAEWKDQARLVMAIPGLRGGHAQLLTGAGFGSVEAIAEAAPDELCAKILAFAATADGHRILRDGHAPDVERIKGWVDAALEVLAA